jgi:hypothetical protein
LDESGETLAMTGYDVALSVTPKRTFALWLGTSEIPKPTQLRSAVLGGAINIQTFNTSKFGTPNRWLRTNGTSALFNCEDRLCVIDFASKKVSLITRNSMINGISGRWITVDGKVAVAAHIDGSLALARP